MPTEARIRRRLMPMCSSCRANLMSISRGEPCVYTLLLEHNRYYVGLTQDLWGRLQAHCEGRGCRFTRDYKPIALLHVAFGGPQLEKHTTLDLMRRKGWWRVRGYAWSQRHLSGPPLEL